MATKVAAQVNNPLGNALLVPGADVALQRAGVFVERQAIASREPRHHNMPNLVVKQGISGVLQLPGLTFGVGLFGLIFPGFCLGRVHKPVVLKLLGFEYMPDNGIALAVSSHHRVICKRTFF